MKTSANKPIPMKSQSRIIMYRTAIGCGSVSGYFNIVEFGVVGSATSVATPPPELNAGIIVPPLSGSLLLQI